MYDTRFHIVTLVASVAAATLFTAGPGALAGGRGAPGIVRAGPPPTAQLGVRASQLTSQPRGNAKGGSILKRGVDISKQLDSWY